MKHNDKILKPWHKKNWKSLLLIAVVFMFSFTQATAQCEWTIEVTSESVNQDEISWELTDIDGDTILEGYFDLWTGIEATGTFSVEAEGPLDFHISTQGTFGDNEADYTISNDIEEVASGHLDGGQEVTESDLNCGILDECADADAGEAMDDFNICANIAFSINVSGASNSAVGLERIWQSSPAGEDDWTDIDGATSTSYTVSDGIDEPMDFRYQVTCTNTDETDISEVITVSLNPGTECYCTPIYDIGCLMGDRISNVSLIGESQSLNNDSECSDDGYADYTDLTPPDLAPGQTYTLSVSTDYISPAFEQVRAWIDYNEDGQFSDDEEIANTEGEGLNDGTRTFEFNVPQDADSGLYRMRVRLGYGSSAPTFDACESIPVGESEDYTVEIIQLDDCQGTPTAGTIDSEDFSVCAENSFTISVADVSEPANGLERIWQSSPAGEDDWTDIAGEHYNTYSVDDGINESTDFRYKVTCTNSDETDISNVITISLNPVNECFCTPEGGTDNPDEIVNFTLGEFSNDSEPSEGENGYSDYSDLGPINLIPGTEYEASITSGSGGNLHGAAIWIDFNDDGIFSEDEKVATISSSIGPDETVVFPAFLVPNNIGQHRLRVQYAYDTDGDELDPCDVPVSSETEDYTVNIVGVDCFPPQDIEIDYITDNSAQVTWEGNEDTNNSWEVIYGSAGFNPEDDGTTIEVDETQVTLEDLNGDTTYEVYVKSICDDDAESLLIGPKPFTTNITPPVNTRMCDAIALTANQGCGASSYTTLGAFEEVDEPSGSCLTNFNGTNTVWFTFVAPNDGETTITTDFPVTNFNTEMVVFKAPTDCNDLNTLGEEVGCAPSGSDVELSGLNPGETYYVKVAGFNNAEGEFCIEVQTDGDTPEPCLAPSDIIVEVGEQSVEVSWTPGGNENQWTVIYGEAGFNPQEDGEMVIINDTPETTLTDLEPNTDYDVYVMANCENDNTSEMVGPETFNSGDMAVEDYLFEDFTYYPNPVKDQLTLNAGTQIESVTVYNLLGQVVLTENPNQLETQLNTESLQAGVYLMKVSLNGSEKSFRVIKR